VSTQITTAYVKQFSDGITLSPQQQQTRLRGAVRVESGITGDRDFFDYIGVSEMSERVGRHTDTVLTDTPHTRRMVTMKTYDKADMVDKRDEVRILNNPINMYTQSYSAAAARKTDKIIIDAASGTAYTGVDGGTGTSHPGGDYQVAHGSLGLTLAKIITARKVLVAAENNPSQGWYFAYGAEQLEDLLNDSTITSADYNSVKMLVSGEMNTFMGFTWIHTEQLTVSSSIRTCLAWCQDALLLGISTDVSGDVSRRPDKNNGLQVSYTMDQGATRMNEVGVVEVLCDES
jgi:hypothetical protein